MQMDNLSDEELIFYSRQIVLDKIGYNGQLKIKNAKVCVIGLGGLGSPASLQLASMGFGYLRLVDYDTIEKSNLQRQLLYSTEFLGFPKVEVAVKKLNGINPHIKIEPITLPLTSNNAEEIIKDMDVIIDGLDSMTPRYALNRASQKLKIPYVFAAAIQTYGNISTIIPGKTPCLECFQGNMDDDLLPKCSVAGVHPSILSIVGSIEVTEATRIILGEKPFLANKILHCNLDNLEFETLKISKSDNCPVCSNNPVADPMPLIESSVRELCSRKGRRVFVITPRIKLNLDMNKSSILLIEKGYKIIVKANLGLVFSTPSNIEISLLDSGVMIVEGVKNSSEALKYYKFIVIELLKYPSSIIGCS
jgi:adenylyltransferase/sulfurtransferase